MMIISNTLQAYEIENAIRKIASIAIKIPAQFMVLSFSLKKK